MTIKAQPWPRLDYDHWADTIATFRLWAQMVGKVRLAHEPWLNHSWHVPLYVSARGLSTGFINAEAGGFDIELDLVSHHLAIRNSLGTTTGFKLQPMSVAEFHGQLLCALEGANVDPVFDGRPNEIPDALPFAEDQTHASYDAAAVQRYWQALLSVDRVFKRFRTGFIGKASPVHLFWGSFDLAVTRFSGRSAPLHPGGMPALPDAVAREAYDHEVSSVGFWPGDPQNPEAAFYSYAYPAPDKFGDASIRPKAASFSKSSGEWLLPYEQVRTASDPDGMLMQFLEDTFQAAARLGRWDRSLEAPLGEVGQPRPLAASHMHSL